MPDQKHILVVDDEPGVCALIETFFTNRGYECRAAGTSREALEIFGTFGPMLILSDIDMTGMNGLELTRNVLNTNPQTAVILMTGNGDAEMVVQALRLGASDYLLKPFDFERAEHSVKQAISKKQALQDKENEVIILKKRLLDALNGSYTSAAKTMETFCKTLEMRDIETFSHVERVSDYSCCLARKMGLNTEEEEVVRIGSLLHDIGKVAVPDQILLKVGPLTEQEWVIMRRHVEAGYRIVSGIPGLEKAAQIILQHHEQYGGGGYPNGVRGEEICLGARIFAVADTYDAITSNRPYRVQRSDAAARAEILKYVGTQFDPKVVEAFSEIPTEEWCRAAISGDKEALAVC